MSRIQRFISASLLFKNMADAPGPLTSGLPSLTERGNNESGWLSKRGVFDGVFTNNQ